MITRIEYTEADVRRLIEEDLKRQTGKSELTGKTTVEVKSKQNFKSEWEDASFRAVYVDF